MTGGAKSPAHPLEPPVNTLLQVGIVLTAIDKMSGVINGATDKAAQGFTQLQAKITRASRAMTEMGTKASLMGHGILAGLETPINAFADLDEASTNLRVAMMDNFGRIPPQFAEINRQAIELGNVLPGTTADFVNSARALIENGTALETVVGGGLKAASYLGVILKLPQAGAAEMVAKFREAFGLAENELTKMADLTQRAKFAFGLNPEEIKYAAQYAGATLNNLKLTGIENTRMFLAMQGIARQKGMEGSVFGTNFASMLNNIGMMEQKLGRNSKIMREVNADLHHAGIRMQFFDKAGNFVGLEKMVAELEKLKVLSSQDKLNVMNKIFGMEGGRVASMLSDAGMGGLHSAMDTMARQADLMKRIEGANQSARNSWEALTGTVTNFWAAVGGPMVTSLYPYMKAVNEFVGGPMMAWVDRNKDLVKWLGLAALASGVLLVTLGGLGIVAGAVAGGLAVVGGVLAAVFSPVTLVVAAVAAGALLVYKYWRPLKAFFKGFWLGLKTGLKPIMPLLESLGNKFGWIADKARELWGWFKGLFTPVETGTGKAAVSGKNFGQSLGDNITKAVEFGQKIADIFGRLPDTISSTWASIKAGVGQLWNVGKSIPERLWFGFKSRAAVLFAGIKEVASELWNEFSALPGKLFDAGAAMLDMLIAGIKSKVGEVVSTVSGLTERIRGFFNRSPAKEGALRDIHQHKFSEMVALAIRPEPIVSAVRAVTAAGMLALAPLANAHALGAPLTLGVPSLSVSMPHPAMPAIPSPQPMPRPVAPIAARQDGRGSMSVAPISINYTVNVQGGGNTDKDSIMAALKAHEHELVRLIQDVMARNARRQY